MTDEDLLDALIACHRHVSRPLSPPVPLRPPTVRDLLIARSAARTWTLPVQWWARRPAAWQVIDRDHTIVGMGESPQEAWRSMAGQRALYLEACWRECHDPHRPVPRSWWLHVGVRMALSRLVRAGAR